MDLVGKCLTCTRAALHPQAALPLATVASSSEGAAATLWWTSLNHASLSSNVHQISPASAWLPVPASPRSVMGDQGTIPCSWTCSVQVRQHQICFVNRVMQTLGWIFQWEHTTDASEPMLVVVVSGKPIPPRDPVKLAPCNPFIPHNLGFGESEFPPAQGHRYTQGTAVWLSLLELRQKIGLTGPAGARSVNHTCDVGGWHQVSAKLLLTSEVRGREAVKRKKKAHCISMTVCCWVYLEKAFPSLALGEKARISFLGCDAQMLLKAERQSLFSKKKISIFPVFKDGKNMGLFCLSALGQPDLLQLPGMQRLRGGGREKWRRDWSTEGGLLEMHV